MNLDKISAKPKKEKHNTDTTGKMDVGIVLQRRNNVGTLGSH